MEASSARIISAGIAAVGVGYGFARYGYGLLLPDIRADFALGSAALGLVGAGSYVGYLAATGASPVLAARVGARGTVAVGLALAVAGMLVVALAGAPLVLALGVVVAGASSGLVFAPFSDVVARALRPGVRDRAIAAISSGTGWGVALAVPVALVAGAAWRAAWLVYAALAALALVWALRVLPGRLPAEHVRGLPPMTLGWFVCPRSGPLLAGAFLLGLGSSAYWTFAVDHVVQAGVAASQARLLLAVVGVASVLGTLSADLVRVAGERRSLGGAALGLAASLVVVGVAPQAWVAVLLSGVLFGAAYNAVAAIQAIWSALVFAERPSAGLAAITAMMAAGMLVGPPLGGALAGALGMDGVFVAGAAVVALVGLLAPRERLSPVGAPAS